MPKTYYCDCQAKCKGEHRQVCRTTYWNHGPYRDPNSQFSGRLRGIFNNNPILYGAPPTAPEGSGSSSSAGVPSTATSESASQAAPRWVQIQEPGADSYRERNPVCAFGINIFGKTNVQFQDSEPRSLSANGLSESLDDISPSGPPPDSPCNLDNVEAPSPQADLVDTEDLRGGLGDSDIDSMHTDDGEDTQPPPLDMSDHRDIPSGDLEDLWMQETIHLDELRTSAHFIQALRHVTLDDPVLGMSTKAIERL